MPSRRLPAVIFIASSLTLLCFFLAAAPETSVHVRLEVQQRVNHFRELLYPGAAGEFDALDADLEAPPAEIVPLPDADLDAEVVKNDENDYDDAPLKFPVGNVPAGPDKVLEDENIVPVEDPQNPDFPLDAFNTPNIPGTADTLDVDLLEESSDPLGTPFYDSSYVCPDAFTGTFTENHDQPDTVYDECIDLETKSDSLFSVTVCHAANSCNAGYVQITRRDFDECKKMESLASKIVSQNPSEISFVTNNLGPDAFEVQIDGPERRVFAIPKYEGQCTYKFPFALANGGRFYVRVYYMFTRYSHYAVRSPEIPSFPDVINKDVLINGSFLLPESYCSTECQRRTYSMPLDLSLLPDCSRHAPNHGVYLPFRDISYYAINHNREFGGGKFKTNFNPVPVGYRWRPICKPDMTILEPKSPELQTFRKNCRSAPRRILFIGDSHTRFLYDALVPAIAGHGDPQWRKALYKTNSVGKIRFDFIWDPYLEDLVSGAVDVSSYDSVFLTCGAHQLFHHTNITEWHVHVSNLLTRLRQISGRPTTITPYSLAKRNGPKFVFMATPSHPPRADKFAKKMADWRTNMHLASWSAYSRKRFMDAGYPVIDSFEMTMPWVRDTIDQGHYRITPAQEAMIQEAILKLNLCPTDPYTGLEKAEVVPPFPEIPLQLSYPVLSKKQRP